MTLTPCFVSAGAVQVCVRHAGGAGGLRLLALPGAGALRPAQGEVGEGPLHQEEAE